MPRWSKENFPKNMKLVESFQNLANEKRCTASQLCLAFIMAQGNDIFPIPGTKSIKYLEENAGALDVVLTEDEIKQIRQELEIFEFSGARYPEWYVTQPGSTIIFSKIEQGKTHVLRRHTVERKYMIISVLNIHPLPIKFGAHKY
jgi:hypothetical protein